MGPIERARRATITEMLSTQPPPKWLLEMRKHYAETGTYRTQDLARLLGDQTRSCDLGRQLEAAAGNSMFRR